MKPATRTLLRLAATAACAGMLSLGAPARAHEPTAGPRLWAGSGLALDPGFAAMAGGVDWFLSPRAGVGIAVAQTLAGTELARAVETHYGFVTLLGRLRAAPASRLRVEILGGAGLSRVRFGPPGAHTEVSPAIALGGALGLAMGRRWELALEATTQVALGERTGTRNRPHTSEVFALAVRWGG